MTDIIAAIQNRKLFGALPHFKSLSTWTASAGSIASSYFIVTVARSSSFETASTAAKKIGATGTLPHDMRRSAVRNFRRSGLSEKEGMALSGHQTSSIYRRYSIISEEDLIESMKRVEQHLKLEKQTARLSRSTKGAHERGEKILQQFFNKRGSTQRLILV